MTGSQSNLRITWPLFDTSPSAERIPASPIQEITDYAPPAEQLTQLEKDEPQEAADDGALAEAEARARKLNESLPPQAPDWMRAARALSDALEALIREGHADPGQQAAVARAWAAWSLGGVTETQILRVSHLVSCTFSALRAKGIGGASQADLRSAAGVLYGGLPLALQERMPRERVLLLVERLSQLPDAWIAVVEGGSDLLGWTHYARVHAASAIRAAMERAGRVEL